jgi:hypothetical protein
MAAITRAPWPTRAPPGSARDNRDRPRSRAASMFGSAGTVTRQAGGRADIFGASLHALWRAARTGQRVRWVPRNGPESGFR